MILVNDEFKLTLDIGGSENFKKRVLEAGMSECRTVYKMECHLNSKTHLKTKSFTSSELRWFVSNFWHKLEGGIRHIFAIQDIGTHAQYVVMRIKYSNRDNIERSATLEFLGPADSRMNMRVILWSRSEPDDMTDWQEVINELIEQVPICE
jgi:hypothetical protein